MNKIKVCAVADFPETGSVMVQGTKPIAVFRLGDRFYALEEMCPHRGGPLHEGRREGEHVVCPWHYAVFNIPDGKRVSGPVRRDLACYPVIRENDVLYVVES